MSSKRGECWELLISDTENINGKTCFNYYHYVYA